MLVTMKFHDENMYSGDFFNINRVTGFYVQEVDGMPQVHIVFDNDISMIWRSDGKWTHERMRNVGIYIGHIIYENMMRKEKLKEEFVIKGENITVTDNMGNVIDGYDFISTVDILGFHIVKSKLIIVFQMKDDLTGENKQVYFRFCNRKEYNDYLDSFMKCHTEVIKLRFNGEVE